MSLSSVLLDNSQSALQTSLRRLSSGSVQSAADDPAALGIAVQLSAQLGGVDQAARNVSDGLSLTDTASSGLGQVSDSLQQLRELALQAGNGTNSPSDLQAIQAQIDQLSQGIDQVAGSTQFDGRNLLDGTFSAQIQNGANPGQTQMLSFADASTTGLGIAGLDVTSAGGAASALTALDHALDSVSTAQGNIGGIQAGLNSTLADLNSTYDNLAATRSNLTDADYAKESSSFAQNLIQNQLALKVNVIYNDVQKSNVLGLISKA